jgi:hypothetical protein
VSVWPKCLPLELNNFLRLNLQVISMFYDVCKSNFLTSSDIYVYLVVVSGNDDYSTKQTYVNRPLDGQYYCSALFHSNIEGFLTRFNKTVNQIVQ